MKKVVAILLATILCLSLVACGNNRVQKAYEEASARRVEAAQNAINALHELSNLDLDDFSSVEEYFAYYDNLWDSLYLTEDAEIHHNEWTSAYVAALDAYNALFSDEQLKIQNADWLNEEETYIAKYEEILIEQEIALYCKDVAVEDLKERLINKSSYEEYGWILDRSDYRVDDYTFWVELKIEYSATNEMGGRIDDTEYVDCWGTYRDGTITITELL